MSRRKAAPCRCRAYRFPHRKGGGACKTVLQRMAPAVCTVVGLLASLAPIAGVLLTR